MVASWHKVLDDFDALLDGRVLLAHWRFCLHMVDTIGKVRRAYFVQKHSIKRIAREQRLARNTVRSIVCAPGEAERCYERRAQPSLRLGVFVPALDAMLAANAAAPKRERLTYLRLFEDLRLVGCRGSYDNVRPYAHA